MVHITLFLPDSGPLEYDAKTFHLDDSGVLTFRIEEKAVGTKTDVSTSVPFLVRRPVEKD